MNWLANGALVCAAAFGPVFGLVLGLTKVQAAEKDGDPIVSIERLDGAAAEAGRIHALVFLPTPENWLAAAKSLGPAELRAQGDVALIQGEIEGRPYGLHLFGCTPECKLVQFSLALGEMDRDLARLNELNLNMRTNGAFEERDGTLYWRYEQPSMPPLTHLGAHVVFKTLLENYANIEGPGLFEEARKKVNAQEIAVPPPIAGPNWVLLGDPEVALAYARKWGPAELDAGRAGWPIIQGEKEGRTYWIEFFGCESPLTAPACSTIGFRTILEPGECGGWDLAAVAELNRRMSYATYLLAPDGSGRLIVGQEQVVAGVVLPVGADVIFDRWWVLADEPLNSRGGAKAKDCAR